MELQNSSASQFSIRDSLLDASDVQYCNSCQKRKHKSLFAKVIKPCTPLADITNVRDNSRGFYQQCSECRGRKARNKQKRDSILREEKDNSKLQSMDNCS